MDNWGASIIVLEAKTKGIKNYAPLCGAQSACVDANARGVWGHAPQKKFER